MPGVRRIKMPVGELINVDVLRISLVDRGANRAPFRITKREGPSEEGQGVLDFYKHFRKEANSAIVAQAEVAAIVVSSGADADKASELIKAAGFSIEKTVKSEEGHTAYVQGETDLDPEKCTYLKFDDNRGVYLRGVPGEEVQKRASTDFGENLGAQQFIPGMFLAHDALASTITNILEEEDTSQEKVVTSIKAAATKFSTFVGDLAEKIPADVFKLEQAFDAEAIEPEAKPEDDKTADPEKDPKVEKSEDEKPKDEKADAKKGEAEDKAGTPDSGAKANVEKSEPDEDGKDPILKAIEGIGAQLKDLKGQVDEAKDTADEAKALAQKADSASAAVGGASTGDPEPKLRFNQGAKVKKGEIIPLMDTARSGSRD